MAYKPFKMKGHTLPGIKQRPSAKMADGRASSSPFQDRVTDITGMDKEQQAAANAHNSAHASGKDPHGSAVKHSAYGDPHPRNAETGVEEASHPNSAAAHNVKEPTGGATRPLKQREEGLGKMMKTLKYKEASEEGAQQMARESIERLKKSGKMRRELKSGLHGEQMRKELTPIPRDPVIGYPVHGAPRRMMKKEIRQLKPKKKNILQQAHEKLQSIKDPFAKQKSPAKQGLILEDKKKAKQRRESPLGPGKTVNVKDIKGLKSDKSKYSKLGPGKRKTDMKKSPAKQGLILRDSEKGKAMRDASKKSPLGPGKTVNIKDIPGLKGKSGGVGDQAPKKSKKSKKSPAKIAPLVAMAGKAILGNVISKAMSKKEDE